jgi:PAS domain-containing protein
VKSEKYATAMKLKHYFLLLIIGIVLLASVALFATFRSHPLLFYVTEGFVVVLLCYLWYCYRKTIRPYDTLIGGMELVKDLDLTTRLAPSGQHETDVIVRTFNDLLGRLRSEHLRLEEQYTFLNLLIEASPMGVIQCDLDGNTTSMNPAAREMLSPSIEESTHCLLVRRPPCAFLAARNSSASVTSVFLIGASCILSSSLSR